MLPNDLYEAREGAFWVSYTELHSVFISFLFVLYNDQTLQTLPDVVDDGSKNE